MKKGRKQKEERPFDDEGPTMKEPENLIGPPQPAIREEILSSTAEENTLAAAILKRGEKVRTKGNWIDVTLQQLEEYNKRSLVVGYDPSTRQVLLKT